MNYGRNITCLIDPDQAHQFLLFAARYNHLSAGLYTQWYHAGDRCLSKWLIMIDDAYTAAVSARKMRLPSETA